MLEWLEEQFLKPLYQLPYPRVEVEILDTGQGQVYRYANTTDAQLKELL